MFDDLAELQRALSGALEHPSGLHDAARIDAITALERLVCTATAAQAHLSAELDAARRAERAAQGVPAARRGRGVAAEVALARRESPHRGEQHLALATVVARELPHTWRAWRRGEITEWKATLVARETACLSLADRRAVDAEISADAGRLERLERMGTGELAAAVRSAAARLDPAAYVARRRQAEADRRVSLRPAPDTMSWLGVLLPVKDGVAVKVSLERAADCARATGDPRRRGQIMADTLVGRVLSGDIEEGPRPQVALHLVMTDVDLFGSSDEPAHLDGFGPIPAELAREIASGALTDGEQVWLRRLYTHPETGELVAMDSRSRLFRASLRRYIRLRDRVCRTPWCDAPVRHSDHVFGADHGGPTSAANGQGLCESCNYAKQAPGWSSGPAPGPGHTVETVLPSGHHHLTRPPPLVATLRRRPLRIDYTLTG